MTVERLQRQIAKAFKSDGSDVIACELMVHPGYKTGDVGGCGCGPDDFSQSAHREHEMSILQSKEMKDFYHAERIEIVPFQECYNLWTLLAYVMGCKQLLFLLLLGMYIFFLLNAYKSMLWRTHIKYIYTSIIELFSCVEKYTISTFVWMLKSMLCKNVYICSIMLHCLNFVVRITYNVCLPLTDFNFIIFTDFTSDELYFLYLPMIFFCKIKLPHILCINCCPQLLAYNFV